MPICLECEKEFDEKRKQKGRQKYCSPKCRYKAWIEANPQKHLDYQRKWFRKTHPHFCRICKTQIFGAGRTASCGSEKCEKEILRLSQEKHRIKRKDKVFQLLGGPSCVYCGCDNMQALEINHKKDFGTREHGTKLLNDICSGRKKKEDFEIVCRVCNALHYMKMKGIKGWKVTWIKEQ